MDLDATVRRRWFGALALVGALAMVAGGETVLRDRMGDVAFLVYWAVCFALTLAAIAIACLDVRAVQRRTREEQHQLLQSTLKEIETKARAQRKPQAES